jgi:hypothetical protein
VDSGLGNLIYWTLSIVTTIICFTTLQHTNQGLWVRYSVLSFLADLSLLLSSWFHAELRTPDLSLLSLLCLHLSLLRQSLVKWVRNTLSTGWVYPLSRKRHLRCAGNVCLGCCENNCLPSRYNGNACVACQGNDPSIPAYRHFVIIYIYTYIHTYIHTYRHA